MITRKTEDGGGSFSYVNAGNEDIIFKSKDQRDVTVKPGERSDAQSVDTGTWVENLESITNNTLHYTVSCRFKYAAYRNSTPGVALKTGQLEIEIGAVYSIIYDESDNTTFEV